MGCTTSSSATYPMASDSLAINMDKDEDTLKDFVPGNAKFDSRVPLTVRQRYNIVKSWKGIARHMEQTGINMFMR